MPSPRPKKSLPKRRPAETATGTAGAIVVILALLGVEVDESVVVAILGAVAALPALVTAITDRLGR